MSWRMAAAAVVAIGTAACGGGKPQANATRDSSAVAAKPAEACGLISLQEVTAITGLKLVPGPVSQDLQGYSECQWSLTPDRTDGIVLVVNRQGKFSDYATAPGAGPLKGYPDSASWNPKLHQMAVKRDTGTIAVSMLPDSAKKAWAASIMKTALGRLKAGKATP